MKNLLLLTALILFFTCCRKKSKDDDIDDGNNNQNPPCELAISTFTINGIPDAVSKDTNYVNGDNNITSEQIVSTNKYCLIDFGGDEKPTVGKYTVTPNYSLILPNTKYCFIQLALNNENFYGQQGELEVYQQGAKTYFKTCNISCKDVNDKTKTLEICGEIK
ncbi:MAG: hypothetical protein KA275_02600 [Chitinophagaceae bacterium]|nr:hypothetical protein [Chitinophagaceae bacterium]